MHFLVIDDRFPSPVYVFLDADPRPADGFPGLSVRRVRLERRSARNALTSFTSVGRNPADPRWYREFGSDREADAAGHQVVEPRFIGSTWKDYSRHFRPDRT